MTFQGITETSRWADSVGIRPPPAGTMDLSPLVGAVEALMSPFAWGGREAWLAQCARRVREVRSAGSPDVDIPDSPEPHPPGDPVRELEALLRLPGDQPDWLQAALDCDDPGRLANPLPITGDVPPALLPLVSLRCALSAGLTTLHLAEWMGPALPTTQELRVSFGLRGREPQVALLAAEGLSNAAIADRLRLSSHTVRHYLERVLDRLGLHTRKALAVRLISGGGERKQGTRPKTK